MATQLRLEGTYMSPAGLGEEAVFDLNGDGSCTITCRTYTKNEKLKLTSMRIPKKEWERFVSFVTPEGK